MTPSEFGLVAIGIALLKISRPARTPSSAVRSRSCWPISRAIL